MVAIFREKSSVSIFWLIALSIVAHGHFLIMPPAIVVTGREAFFFSFLLPLRSLPDFLLILLYHAIIIVQALRFNTVLNDLRMFPKQYFVTALCYILLTSLYPAWGNITPALVTNFVVIWLFSMLAKLYNPSGAKPLIYNIGLITGLLCMVYLPALFLVIIAFFAVGSLRIFRVNEWMVLLLGLLTPVYFAIALLFLSDNLSGVKNYLPQFQPHLFNYREQVPVIIAGAAGSFAVLAGLFAWQANAGRAVVQVRRSWGVLMVMFLLSIPLVFLLKNGNFNYIILGLLPAAAVASNLFVYSKSNVYQTIVFWALIGIIIYNNWFWLKT